MLTRHPRAGCCSPDPARLGQDCMVSRISWVPGGARGCQGVPGGARECQGCQGVPAVPGVPGGTQPLAPARAGSSVSPHFTCCRNPPARAGCMGLNCAAQFNKKCIKIIKMESHGYYLSSVCLATPCYFTYRSSGNISKTH